MNYRFHTTRHHERVKVLTGGNFEWKKISPEQMTNFDSRSVVWEEDTGRIYDISYRPIWETLEQFEQNPNVRPEDTAYFKEWVGTKGPDYCYSRLRRLLETYESMKSGFRREAEPYCVSVTTNGEKLDGSHRAVIAQFLGIPEIEVREYSIKWTDIDDIDRFIATRKTFGPNYYYIDYGVGTNMPKLPVYHENSVERWGVLKDLIDGRVLDLGCNEGFMSIQCALRGQEVLGIDHEFIENANTNKLIFEFLNKRDLPVKFSEGKIQDFEGEYDTALLLNVIYHLPRADVLPLLQKLRKSVKKVVMQGNLRKMKEHDRFYGITSGDMEEMLREAGFRTQTIEWRDKPICVGT